ncbi:hypothetical protein QAD02_011713 [Eretmocerus hayati]|uniref:Uncharacterized protein n=1 Tax=Eretmocerus hayati TaxID=131215 RepID=A0ACC2P0F8_9HYME|nr:hypothetical protein QAD02_011713 [Eretmocerus hayati]
MPQICEIPSLPNHQLQITSYELFSSSKLFEKENLVKSAKICHHLGLPEVSQLIKREKNHTTYDLLLVHDVSTSSCFTAIGYLLNIPVVNIVTTKLNPRLDEFVGNPSNLALPASNCWDSNGLTLWSRLQNFRRNLAEINFHSKKVNPEENIVKSYFGYDFPSFAVLEKTISLILTNSHYTFNGIVPKVPAVVEIGGIHIVNDTSPMSQDLKTLLDNSKDGFIYFSLGSMTLIESFPDDLLQKFLNVFRKIPSITIIMRVQKPELMPDNLPHNIYMQPWLPQQKIIQHKNIKGFVTHGGAHGVQEAVYHAVPMICIPLYYEQDTNCEIVDKKNIGLRLDLQDSQLAFDHAFKEISSNAVFKEQIHKLSAQYRDRPRSPSEEAVYWIEYIIRHGPKALRSPIIDLPWWQKETLDIYALFLVLFGTIVILTTLMLRFLFTLLIRMEKPFEWSFERSQKKIK